MAASTRASEAPAAVRASRHPALLSLALAAAATYAAFASGATRAPQDARLEVLLALVTLLAVAGWAAGGPVGLRARGPALVGLGLLAGLALWSSASVAWSITPDRSWVEANRTLAYALVVGLAVALGSSDPRAIERLAVALLGGASLVALYAFATKVVPGVGLGLDQPGGVGRLRSPLGYWNATALVVALAVPTAVRIACGRERGAPVRAGALGAGLLLVCVLGLTDSRGGVLALGVATVVLTALGGARLRGLLTLAALGAASAPVLAVGFGLAGTSDFDVELAVRVRDGRVLLAVFLACLATLLAAALALWRLEPRVRWSAGRTRELGRGFAILVAVGALFGTAALAASDRGLPGTIAERAEAFTEPSRDDASDPGRLATTTSGNRWVWWREAVGAWSDRPVAGWGAGSFRATHLRYRVDELPVTQAHSVPLQLLAETGAIGLLLFAGAIGGLGLAALTHARGLPAGPERDMAVAALAAVAGWLVHGLFDWDWNIPGASLPALLLLGVLAGAGGARATGGTPRAAAPAVVAGAVVALSLVVASAVLPAWADGKASAAQAAAGASSDAATLQDAAAEAALAARLDPTALRPLLASAAIARRRGRPLDARRFLLDAVARQPESVEAWSALAGAALELADRVGFERAALRALELDPRSPRTRQLALAAVAYRTPPGGSATATGTPLTPRAIPAPVVPVAPAVPPVGATGASGPTAAGGATGATGRP